MKIVVCGSRYVTSYELVKEKIEQCIKENNIRIAQLVSGGAKGVDTLAENWAIQKGIEVIRFPANWDKYGLSAGPIRNRQMANYCDIVIAIWDGKSRGTKNMIDYSESIKKKVYIYPCDFIKSKSG